MGKKSRRSKWKAGQKGGGTAHTPAPAAAGGASSGNVEHSPTATQLFNSDEEIAEALANAFGKALSIDVSKEEMETFVAKHRKVEEVNAPAAATACVTSPGNVERSQAQSRVPVAAGVASSVPLTRCFEANGDKDVLEVSGKVFGSKEITKETLDFILAGQEVDEIGWGKPAYPGDQRKLPFKREENNHVWVVDEKGEILDYPDEQLRMLSDDHGHKIGPDGKEAVVIVHRPFDMTLSMELFPWLERQHKEFMQAQSLTKEDMLQRIHEGTFPIGCCYHRAKILRDSDPSSYGVVIGSLGFKQPDGRIWWEYG